MGRGRAKAKQTKVARQLKYSSGGTDLDRLQAELSGAGSSRPTPAAEPETDDDYDGYSDYDDEEPEASSR